jgi:hypothetical protein
VEEQSEDERKVVLEEQVEEEREPFVNFVED